MSEEQFEYHEEGQVSGTIATVISMFVGLGVLVLIIILLGVLGGKAYNTVAPSLNVDNNALNNLRIEQDINNSIVDAFAAYGDAVAFIGIIVLALVFFLVLALLGSGMRPFTGGGTGAI